MKTRKPIRLQDYDYSSAGAYFITICVKDRLPVLSSVCTSDTTGMPEAVLTELGIIVDNAIGNISRHYPDVELGNYVIMPNHVHMVLIIKDGTLQTDNNNTNAVKISTIISQMKGYISKKCCKTIWQKSYYDHIIRNEHDFHEIMEYIDNNPARWLEDELYIPISQ